MAHALQAVTWDLVGTLCLPHPSVGAVYAEVAARHGIERDAAELEAAFPGAFARVRERWAVPYGASEDDARHFWGTVIQETFEEGLPYELILDLYDAFGEGARWRVLPGAREALALVAASGLPQAVVSNFDQRLVPVVEQLALGPFACLVASNSVGRAKPDPAALLAACLAMAVAPSAVLHVGDSAREDGGMCAQAGARWLPVAGEAVPLDGLRDVLAGR
jgi:putative hydrolase of the HAD superfamily